MTINDILPRVPAGNVDTLSRNVTLEIWLTTLELGLIEQLIVLGNTLMEPELPNSVVVAANACTTKLSE